MKETRNRQHDGRRLCRGLAMVAGLAAIAHLSLSGVAAATDSCTSRLLHTRKAHPGDLIELKAAPGLPKKLISKAVAVWEQCSNYGVGFPAFVRDAEPFAVVTPVRSLTVQYHWLSGSSACGRFRGHEIHVYAFALNAAGQEVHCGSPVLVLAHELGHVLGLADGDEDEICREHIMAQIEASTRYRRRVHESECQVASQRWLTAAERRAAESAE